MRIKTLIGGLIAAFALASPLAPAYAQQATQSAEQRPDWVNRFDDQVMRFILADLNARWTVEQGADGSLTYRATTQEGINFVLAPRSCDTQNVCAGLVLIALFNDLNAPNAARLDAFINRYNDLYPTAKVMRNPQGMVALQSYINAAYGVTYRNVQAQLLVFGQNITSLSRALLAFENGEQG